MSEIVPPPVTFSLSIDNTDILYDIYNLIEVVETDRVQEILTKFQPKVNITVGYLDFQALMDAMAVVIHSLLLWDNNERKESVYKMMAIYQEMIEVERKYLHARLGLFKALDEEDDNTTIHQG